jgi:transcriptional regulator with XRE-family HTH domain
MQHKNLRFPKNREKLIAHAVATDDGCVAVGGLAAKLGLLQAPQPIEPSEQKEGVEAIAKLVQLSRREWGMDHERFAEKVGMEVSEVRELETSCSIPEPRVLYKLSTALKVSYHKLLVLAGHRRERIEWLEQEKLKFAASSGPMDKLTKAESQALQDFIRALHE